jgi:3-oxoacyl-[acyl-carrier protein] reductase
VAATVLHPGQVPFFPVGCAVVIGGSGGVGGAICRGLANHGANVVLSYRSNADAAAAVVTDIEACGREARALPLSLAEPAAVVDFMDRAKAAHGRVHTVVVATGADISMTYVSGINPCEWRRTIDSDLNGFFYVIRAALPILRDGGGGAIVAITSAGNFRHPPKDILSTVPKAGIEALIRGIAREEGRHGIRANAVALGVIDGGLFRRLEPQVTQEFVEAMKNNTAARRLGTVEEAADAAIFLACDRSRFITGVSLAVDGGYSI